MNCRNCGAPYDPELNKCSYCGTPYIDFSENKVEVPKIKKSNKTNNRNYWWLLDKTPSVYQSSVDTNIPDGYPYSKSAFKTLFY